MESEYGKIMTMTSENNTTIEAGAGSSDIENSVEAANAAAKQAMDQAGIVKADWALVFCTFLHRANYEEILKIVCQVTQTKNVRGF